MPPQTRQAAKAANMAPNKSGEAKPSVSATTSNKRQREDEGMQDSESSPSKFRRTGPASEASPPKVTPPNMLPSSFSEKLGSEVIEFIVGKNKRTFYVHKMLISNSVTVFDRMLRGGFQEAIARSVELPDDSSGAFDLFIGWCYKGLFKKLNISASNGQCFGHIKLYCFAEKYGVLDLLDPIMASLRNRTLNRRFQVKWCNYIYQNAHQNSPLRSLASRCFCHKRVTKCKDDAFTTIHSPFNNDFVLDMINLMRNPFPERLNPNHGPSCQYHHHGINSILECSEYIRNRGDQSMSINADKVLRCFKNFPDITAFVKNLSQLDSLKLSDLEATWATAELVALGDAEWVGEGKDFKLTEPGKQKLASLP